MAITCEFTYPNNGLSTDRFFAKQAGLTAGRTYKVRGIQVGGFTSTILLDGLCNFFNSTQFAEFKEDGRPIDIYGDPRFVEWGDVC